MSAPDKQMIERVARAIADDQLKRRYGPGWERMTKFGRAHLRRDAEAALSAITPPNEAREALEIADAHKDREDFTLPSERALRTACHLADCQWTAINMMRQKGTIEPGFVRAIYAFARYIDNSHDAALAKEKQG